MAAKWPRILWPALIVLALVVTYRLYQSTARLQAAIAEVNRQNLERAVLLAEATLEHQIGSGPCSPSRAAAALVEHMQRQPAPRSDIEAQGKPVGSGIAFNEAQAFEPWQVAVVPDERRRVIRLEGYGKSLSEPVIVKEVACP